MTIPSVIRRCMDFGASGFIPKTLGVEQMRDAIKRVLGGGVWTPPDVDLSGGSDAESAALMARLATLTPQQVRVLMMLSEGMLNKQIAYELSVSEATVKAHVSAILQKLGVDSRTQAVIAAAKIEVGQWPQAAEPALNPRFRLTPPPRPAARATAPSARAAPRASAACSAPARRGRALRRARAASGRR